MLQDSHTSVAGMRELADYDHCVVVKNIRELDSLLKDNADDWRDVPSTSSRNLFVLTPMSNFCGRKYDLRMASKMREGSTR